MPTKRISVVLLARSLEVGGAERQLVGLARGLRERGHLVKIVLFYRRGALLADLEGSGIPIVDLRKAGRWDIVRFLLRGAVALRRERPQIIYSFLGGANLVACAIRPFVRGSRFVWSIRASNMDLDSYDWVRRLAYRLECRLSRTPDLIIANSSAGAAHSVGNGFAHDRIVVIPNGIDTDRFKPDPGRRAAQRSAWGLRGNQIAVGLVARLDPMKGHKIFLKAAQLAGSKNPEMRFFCVGSGPQMQSLELIADELGLGDRLVFTGESEPVAALNALDIACSSSLWGEGFSNSIAEAMACGLPCIVTDVGDSGQIVGATGTVVPPGSATAIANAILRQAELLASHRADEPRARIIENFSMSMMVENTLQAFHEQLGL